VDITTVEHRNEPIPRSPDSEGKGNRLKRGKGNYGKVGDAPSVLTPGAKVIMSYLFNNDRRCQRGEIPKES